MSDKKKNQKNGPSFRDVALKARENPEDFATTVIGSSPTLKNAGSVRYFDNQSLIVYTNGNRKGKWQNFSDETAHGDMLDLCRYIRGMTPEDAFHYAKGVLGISDDMVELGESLIKPKSQAEIDKENEEIRRKKIRTAQWIWRNSSPTDGKEEGEAYLKNRGLKGPFDPNLIRYRRLSPEDLKKMGAKAKDIPDTPVVSVVFKATNAAGEITAVQQILTTQGKKVSAVKPDFENVKRTNGYLTGSAVKFGGETPEKVILAEGPETALSLFESTKIPTWITLGTSNYTTIEMPTTVKEALVAADIEPSGIGLASAMRAAQHWSRVGVPKVGIPIPRLQDGDFNDVHKKHGPDVVKKTVDAAFYAPETRARDTVVVSPDARAAFHVWQKTGLETIVRVPGVNKRTNRRFPIALDGMVEDHHKNVVLMEHPDFDIVKDGLQKTRPDINIQTLTPNSTDFLQNARQDGYVEKSVAELVDIHAPSGKGKNEPMAFCLRRKDADALHEAGHKAIAIRSTGIEKADLSFMKGRKAFVCPIGEGTEDDKKLANALTSAGADTLTLKWQLFAPKKDGDGYEVKRNSIPEGYGAADAVKEGWKDKQMSFLIKNSTPEKETTTKQKNKEEER